MHRCGWSPIASAVDPVFVQRPKQGQTGNSLGKPGFRPFSDDHSLRDRFVKMLQRVSRLELPSGLFDINQSGQDSLSVLFDRGLKGCPCSFRVNFRRPRQRVVPHRSKQCSTRRRPETAKFQHHWIRFRWPPQPNVGWVAASAKPAFAAACCMLAASRRRSGRCVNRSLG